MDIAKNFAKAIVTTGYSAAATSITVATGYGARFPVAPFNAIWKRTDYGSASDDPNVEIVRVIAIVGDVFTITRAQEGTNASDKNANGKTYEIACGPTAKWFNTDIPDLIDEKIADAAEESGSYVQKDFYPRTIAELKAIESKATNNFARVKADADGFARNFWWDNASATPDIQPDDFDGTGGWMFE